MTLESKRKIYLWDLGSFYTCRFLGELGVLVKVKKGLKKLVT